MEISLVLKSELAIVKLIKLKLEINRIKTAIAMKDLTADASPPGVNLWDWAPPI
jgi:hypothetical protein